MFCPLFHPAFAHHFEMCKSRAKQKIHRKIDKMIDRVYEQALSDLKNFFTFDQSRLTAPRVDTSSDGPSLYPCSYQNQSTSLISQNCNHLTDISFKPTLSHFYPQNNGLILIDPCFNRQSIPIPPVPSPPVSITDAKIILHNKLTNTESCQLPLKLRFKIKTANEPMETVQAQHSPLSSLSSSSVVNEPSTNNLNDENVYESDNCLNGINGDEEIDDDDDDSVQWIDDDQENEESTLLMKKPRQDPTQLNNALSSVTSQSVIISRPKQIHEPQPTEVNKESSSQSSSNQPTPFRNSNKLDMQIITLSLQCPNCPRTFVREKLRQHMLDEHSIERFRCLVKDCAESFDCRFNFGYHIKNVHQHTNKWHCDKCPKYTTSYKLLTVHNTRYHQLGHFQCAFSQCTFIANCKANVRNHYARAHKATQLHCAHCNYQTNDPNFRRIHQQTHSDIKPYRCKWPGCDYAATALHYTILHIQCMHFARNFPPSSLSNGAQLGHPQDYVEVLTNLF